MTLSPPIGHPAVDALRRFHGVVARASLALYGLKPPPELAVEVKTRTGKQVLHIGRQEGGSKRYYARVVDADNTAVFVISEEADTWQSKGCKKISEVKRADLHILFFSLEH